MATFGPLQMTIGKNISIHTSVKLHPLFEYSHFYFQRALSAVWIQPLLK